MKERISLFPFGYCTNLTNVTMTTGVTGIGDFAFYRCSSLTGVTIPGSVTSLGNYAFSSTSLASVTVPGSVRKIGKGAFLHCANLGSIHFGGNAPKVEAGLFDTNNTLTVYYMPGARGWKRTFAGHPAVVGH
jgi:hypothetical protein